MAYRMYEVDISFEQRSGATIPVASKSLEEVSKIVADLFPDLVDLKIEEVRPLPTMSEALENEEMMTASPTPTNLN